MQFPDRFSDLPPYAFARLRTLLDSHAPGGEVLHMTIGEPRHEPPAFVAEVLAEAVAGFRFYPPNAGTPELCQAIADWLLHRYGVRIDAGTEVLPLNGTREGLFNAAIALCPEGDARGKTAVLMPNPFYPVYSVAALAVGATPHFAPATSETGFLPDYATLPADVLDRTALVYICSPANPQGAVASEAYWRDLIALAERHDFRILADECYCEIWRDAPPPGALQVARAMGADPERVAVFHSLSKRSNLPGLRSGFVASGPRNIAAMKQLRDYSGAPMSLPVMSVATRCWRDEVHVEASRARYATKFGIADDVFNGIDGCGAPQAGFFLWLPVEDGEAAALKVWRQTGVRLLPGAYLGREVGGTNPGAGYVRAALVTDEDETLAGLTRVRDCLYT